MRSPSLWMASSTSPPALESRRWTAAEETVSVNAIVFASETNQSINPFVSNLDCVFVRGLLQLNTDRSLSVSLSVVQLPVMSSEHQTVRPTWSANRPFKCSASFLWENLLDRRVRWPVSEPKPQKPMEKKTFKLTPQQSCTPTEHFCTERLIHTCSTTCWVHGEGNHGKAELN